MQNNKHDSSGSGALRRGLLILALLHRNHPVGLPIRSIVQETGLPRPTVYRLLDALLEEGYVFQGKNGKAFGFAGFSVSRDKGALFKSQALLTARMRTLAEVTGNSVYLIVRKNADAMCVHREFGAYPIQISTLAIGQRHPLGVGAAGLALLSAYGDDVVDTILRQNSERLQAHGGMTVKVIRQLIKNSRTRGFSIVGQYAVEGVTGIGVAIKERGKPVAGLSICSTTERIAAVGHRAITTHLTDAIKDVVT